MKAELTLRKTTNQTSTVWTHRSLLSRRRDVRKVAAAVIGAVIVIVAVGIAVAVLGAAMAVTVVVMAVVVDAEEDKNN